MGTLGIMHSAADGFARLVRKSFIAAIATPMTASGVTDSAVTRAYAEEVISQGADGVAAAVHTGRGPELRTSERCDVIRAAREATDLVVTGAYLAENDADNWPRQAADAGASALLLFTPPSWETDLLWRGIDRVWDQSGLPLILFDLYSAPLKRDTLATLMEHPAVAAFKPARLHDRGASREGIDIAARSGRTVLTGEDLMLPETLSWGATGALVGLGAACTRLTAEFLKAHRIGDHDTTRVLNPHLSAFAAATFTEPMDAYVQRMLWIAVDEGIVPAEYGFDPRGSIAPDEGTRAAVLATARAAGDALTSLLRYRSTSHVGRCSETPENSSAVAQWDR